MTICNKMNETCADIQCEIDNLHEKAKVNVLFYVGVICGLYLLGMVIIITKYYNSLPYRPTNSLQMRRQRPSRSRGRRASKQINTGSDRTPITSTGSDN